MSSDAKAPTDFTGYWVLSHTEQLDEFLKNLGFPWVVRKAALKFGSGAVDLIHHVGTVLKVTSLNAKGSWTRVYDTERVVEQRNAEGVMVRTKTWWEGSVLRTRLEGSPLGPCDSWRYRRGDVLVVKTAVKTPRGAEATCFFFFERMESLQQHVAGASRPALLRALAADQKRVETATRRDTADLQRVVLDWNRWASPADEFIRVASPSYVARRGAGAGQPTMRALSGSGSPLPMSKSPSSGSLSASALASPPSEGRSEAVRSRLAGGGGSSVALEHLAGGVGGASSVVTEAGSSAAEAAPPPPALQPQPLAEFTKELSLVDRETGVVGLPAAAGHGGAAAPPQPASDVTFPKLAPAEPPSGAAHSPALPPLHPHAPRSPPPGVEAAPSPPGHRRQRSVESSPAAAAGGGGGAGARRLPHYRSPSAELDGGAAASGHSPSPTPSQRGAPTGGEALMVYKMHEFLDGRGIMSVVPVASPNDTSEPQLLGMSPEQAEETAARLRELETDMLLSRQANKRGLACCGLLLAWEKDSLPEHLRVWEMTLV